MGKVPWLFGEAIATPQGWVALVNVWAELNRLYINESPRFFDTFKAWKVLKEARRPYGWGVRVHMPYKAVDSMGTVSTAMWYVLKDIDAVAVLCGEATPKPLEPDVIRPIRETTSDAPDVELMHMPENRYTSFHTGKLNGGEDRGRHIILRADQVNAAAIAHGLRAERSQESRDSQTQERIWERLASEYLREHGTEGITKACLKEIVAPEAGVNEWKRVWDRLKREFPELGRGGRRRKTSTPKKT